MRMSSGRAVTPGCETTGAGAGISDGALTGIGAGAVLTVSLVCATDSAEVTGTGVGAVSFAGMEAG